MIGGLTYDNEHLVNADPQNPKGGQPKRLSLWEIHPITAFLLCRRTNGCDATHPEDWVRLSTVPGGAMDSWSQRSSHNDSD